MQNHHIPEQFQRQMIDLHGDEGAAWLARLPDILAVCEERWGISIQPPFPNLSYHYVTPAIRTDGTPVVVKACSPTDEFETELTAMRHFDGHGFAKVLAFDEIDEVMLLERLVPGTPLTQVEDDEEATRCAAAVMREIWRPGLPDYPFKTVSDWGKGFARLRQYYNGGSGPFPPALLLEAEGIFAEFCASESERVLLHGDLHHDNMLAATRQPYLAIDPKGVIGEPAYETAAMLHNPLPQVLDYPNPGHALERRVAILSEMLGFERARIRGWGMAQAVLSAWWVIEDFGRLEGFGKSVLTCAELLAKIKG